MKHNYFMTHLDPGLARPGGGGGGRGGCNAPPPNFEKFVFFSLQNQEIFYNFFLKNFKPPKNIKLHIFILKISPPPPPPPNVG